MFSDGIIKAVEQHTGYNLANMFPSYRVAHLLSGAVSKAKECHCSLDRQLDEIIREHREKGADEKVEDFLTVLLRLHDEGSGTDSLSMDSVKAVITDLIAAGSVTTAVSLDWIMAELMKNPAIMKKAQFEVRQQLQGRENITKSDVAKMEFMHLIIKETMRLHPPVPFISRECQEACQILGYNIPKGTSVLINVWSLGRDSMYWKDAEEFRPERFAEYNRDVNFRTDFELIPFGAGRRICPGMSFTIVTVELALANLLYHFDWELPSGMKPDDLDMAENSGFTVSRKSPLLLHARPYHRIHASS
ncbi:hypothetical protein LUZ61_014286 [Rhynchospora tenuis]|uniref:Cytochrome P450 n=1 Tax=Rhynchospora tenuis TaxID=198213 RepID=A0AAD5WAH7_9POAL|nr:hypothetical protein LUZ61_014286 [Rhynchospora tenuis]